MTETTPATPATPAVPPAGTLMTVQIRDEGGTVHAFHGTRGAIHKVVTNVYTRRDTRQVRYLRTIGSVDSDMTGEDPATVALYLTIHSATGGRFERGTLAHSDAEHFFSAGENSLSVRLHDAETITFAAAEQEGEQWVQEHLSLDKRKSRFLDRLSALDGDLSAEAWALFDAVAQQERHRGYVEGYDSAGGF